jgi:hypothetical protein
VAVKVSVIEDAVLRFAKSVKYQGPEINERYLHHALSFALQRCLRPILPSERSVDAVIHPEWPTCKSCKSSGNYAKYAWDSDTLGYRKTDEGSSGFLDFAVGSYWSPTAGIELTIARGWNGRAIVFDLMKLLDPDSPFDVVFSLNYVFRDKGLSHGRSKQNLGQRINQLVPEARQRLGQFKKIPSHLVIVEAAPTEKNNWLWTGVTWDRMSRLKRW